MGAHDAHLGDGALAQTVECNECHVVPMVGGRLVTDAPGHLDAVTTGVARDLRAEVTFGGRAVAGGVVASYGPDTTIILGEQ